MHGDGVWIGITWHDVGQIMDRSRLASYTLRFDIWNRCKSSRVLSKTRVSKQSPVIMHHDHVHVYINSTSIYTPPSHPPPRCASLLADPLLLYSFQTASKSLRLISDTAVKAVKNAGLTQWHSKSYERVQTSPSSHLFQLTKKRHPAVSTAANRSCTTPQPAPCTFRKQHSPIPPSHN